jgi:signal peptidase I
VTKIKEKQTIPSGNKEGKKRKGKLRENIESIAIAIALAFAIRFFVIEAFKIPTGSMAPTLLGEHKNVNCSNCGWAFYADRQSESATCPNCESLINISAYCEACDSRIRYNWPAWLWRKGSCPTCQTTTPWADLSNRVIHGGNRILVNKFWYKFKNPQRWDVVVFIYPLYDLTCKNCSLHFPDTRWYDGLRCQRCGSTSFSKKKKNYIKRLVGLPGEKLQILNGDIYINDKIQRKPDHVQDILWLPVYDSHYPPKEESTSTWIASSNTWKIDKKTLTLDNLSDGNPDTSLVTFGRHILDHNGYNNRSGNNEMGDIKISFDATPLHGSQCLELILEKNNDEFTAIIPTNDTNMNGYLKKSGNVVMEKDIHVQTGKTHKIEFSNVDQVVTLSIDNQKVFVYDDEDGTVPQPRSFDTSSIRFGGTDVNAVFENIKIFHDIYYTDLSPGTLGTAQPIQLGEKDYFMLGDNSRNSNDSRIWKFVPEKNIVGKAFFVFWPLNNIRFIK